MRSQIQRLAPQVQEELSCECEDRSGKGHVEYYTRARSGAKCMFFRLLSGRNYRSSHATRYSLEEAKSMHPGLECHVIDGIVSSGALGARETPE
jgi:hypothetical protein